MKNAEQLLPGHLYAPLGDYHIGIKQIENEFRLVISEEGPVTGHRPSVDFLFCSAASLRAKILAVLLTGMGKDGAFGLSLLHQNGADTIVQDEASCVVFGMPKEAIALGAAKKICNPSEIRTLVHAAAGSDPLKSAV